LRAITGDSGPEVAQRDASVDSIGGLVKQLSLGCLVVTAMMASPWSASAQQPGVDVSRAQGNVPGQAQQAQAAVSDVVRKWGIGVDGGVGLNPELIMFGAHGTFGPIFKPSIQFRPGIEFGVGEVTTLFGINLDVTYTFSGSNAQGGWAPYLGAGPNFTLSHQGFDSADFSSTTTTTTTVTSNGTTTTRNRFNFSDTDFDGGFNFIAGARRDKMFVEMKATAYGVKNVRLMAGFNF
jgi:hypothetical protein